MNTVIKSLLINYLKDTIDRLENDDCAISLEEANTLVSSIMHIELKKSEAAERLGISTRTFDRRVSSGEIPQGKHVIHHKDLVWYLDEILKIKEE